MREAIHHEDEIEMSKQVPEKEYYGIIRTLYKTKFLRVYSGKFKKQFDLQPHLYENIDAPFSHNPSENHNLSLIAQRLEEQRGSFPEIIAKIESDRQKTLPSNYHAQNDLTESDLKLLLQLKDQLIQSNKKK